MTRPATVAARTGIGADLDHGAVVPPIHLSANFLFDAPGVPRGYDYTRSGNPTRDLAAEAVALLEGGAGALLTSSGMSAIALVTHLLEPGDTLVAPHDGYGGLHRLLVAESARVGFRVVFLDQGAEASLEEAAALEPRMVWLESPSNPLLRITDLGRWTAAAREWGALSVVDNTLLSPVLQRPLALGADLVVHSATKFLNGHSDVVGGAVVAAREELHERLAWWANCLGLAGSPFDAWLLLRGIRTLEARVAVHQRNARGLVSVAERHPAVEAVHYPGLPHHPGHALAAEQQDGFGSLFTLALRGGQEAVDLLSRSLRHFSLAESLGGVESLVCQPATMTHASMTPAARERAGIGAGLVRFSAGIEAEEDLVQDLEGALDRVAKAGQSCAPRKGGAPC